MDERFFNWRVAMNRDGALRVPLLCVSGVLAAVGLLGLPVGAWAQSPSACGPLSTMGAYGPYDYVTQRGRIEIVEQHHFTPKVEALIAGESGYLGGDLNYTLIASPNHHRALLALMRYGARTHVDPPPNLTYTIDCYFDRAIRFSPNDTVVRDLFAVYLKQHNRNAEAIHQLDAASELITDNGMSHFNTGLLYFELGQFQSALREAHRARKLGFENTLLEDKLKAVNQWKDATE